MWVLPDPIGRSWPASSIAAIARRHDLYDPAQGPGTDPSSTAMEPDVPAIPGAPPTAMPDSGF